MKASYYQVVKPKRWYKGERYFKFIPTKDSVVQILVSAGDKKKGRTACKGVYLISRTTFLCNYNLHKYSCVEEITMEQFYAQYDRIQKKLIKY